MKRDIVDYSQYFLLYWPYFAVFISLALLALVFDFSKTSKSFQLFLRFTLVGVLALFSGTRVGWSDQDGYLWIFDMVAPLPVFVSGQTFVEYRIEYFYLLFNSIVKCFTENPMYLFISVAFFVVALNLRSLKKYSPYFFLSVLVYYSNYYYVGTMTAMRQGMSAAVIFFGMAFLVEKRWTAFFITIGVATLFHFSAIFVLFGFLLYRLNFSSRILFFLVIGSFILGFISPISHWLFGHFVGLGDLSPQIQTGLSYLEDQDQGFALGVLRPTSLKQLMICLLAIKYRDFLVTKLKYYNVLFVFYCAATMWRFVFNDIAVLAARVGGLLSIGEPVIVVSFLLLFKPEHRRWIALWIVLFAAGSLYLNFKAFVYPPYVSALFGGQYWKEGFFGF